MKIFVEVLDKNQIVKTKGEYITILDAEDAKSILAVNPDEAVRIHKCYHVESGEKKNKPCNVS